MFFPVVDILAVYEEENDILRITVFFLCESAIYTNSIFNHPFVLIKNYSRMETNKKKTQRQMCSGDIWNKIVVLYPKF